MRWALLLGALLLNGLLASAWRSPAERAVVYPLAPPLTRIAAMGERALNPTGTPPPPAAEPLRALAPLLRSSATADQRALLQRAQSIEGEVAPMLSRSQALRRRRGRRCLSSLRCARQTYRGHHTGGARPASGR